MVLTFGTFSDGNFPVVADILHWLVKQASVSTTLDNMKIDTQEHRMQYIKMAVEEVFRCCAINLSIKRLYKADNFAVKELLKVVDFIYYSVKNSRGSDGDIPTRFIYNSAREDKLVSSLATEITHHGASLHELIGDEANMNKKRTDILRSRLDLTETEGQLKVMYNRLQEKIHQIEAKIKEIQTEEMNIDAKIAKKQEELDRQRKRLSTMQGVKPAFVEQHDKIKKEAMKLYNGYVTKVRNMQHVEHELDTMQASEDAMIEAQREVYRKVQSKLKEEEMRVLRGGTNQVSEEM